VVVGRLIGNVRQGRGVEVVVQGLSDGIVEHVGVGQAVVRFKGVGLRLASAESQERLTFVRPDVSSRPELADMEGHVSCSDDARLGATVLLVSQVVARVEQLAEGKRRPARASWAQTPAR
jgi:hypothetical protein